MLGLLLGLFMTAKANMYPRAMEIVEIKDNVAVCVDAVGMEWEFDEPEDLMVGDIVICTMYNKGTTDTIVDDEIVDVVYSGYVSSDLVSAFE